MSDCIRGEDSSIQENNISTHRDQVIFHYNSSYNNYPTHWIYGTYTDELSENSTGLLVKLNSMVNDYQAVAGNAILSYTAINNTD